MSGGLSLPDPSQAASGLNPEISLKAQSPALGQTLSPLSTIAGLAKTQAETANLNTQNQYYKTQAQRATAEFAARHKAGQLIATSPDIPTALDNIRKDSEIMGYAPGVAKELTDYVNATLAGKLTSAQIGETGARTNLLNTQQTETQTNIGQSAAKALHSALSSAVADPTTAGDALNRALALMPPNVRTQATPVAKNLLDSINLGPSDPDSMKKRVIGLVAGGGIPLDQVYAGAGLAAPTVSMQPVGPGAAPQPALLGGVGPNSGLGQTTAGPAPVSGPTQTEAAANEATGKAIASYQEEVGKTAAAIPGMAIRLNNLTDAMTRYQAGGLAEVRTSIGSFMQGIDNAAVDAGGKPIFGQARIDNVANHSLSDSQFFLGQIKSLMTKQLAADAAGTGRVMLPEVAAALSAVAGTNDPVEILKYFDQARTALQMSYQKTQMYPQYRALIAKKDPSVAGRNELDYDSWYNDHADTKNLPKTTVGGIPLERPTSLPIQGASDRALPSNVDWSKYYK